MSSKWNRPMREYRAPVLMCEACGLRITGEVKMLGSAIYHPVCASKVKR